MICRLDLSLALMAFDLLDDSRVLPYNAWIVNLLIASELARLCVSTLLLCAEIRDLEEPIIRQCHDQTTP